MHLSLEEASKKLGITKSSLMHELQKNDCPYGFSIEKHGKRIYHVSSELLDKWIKEHPEKYSIDPNYMTIIPQMKLSEIPTEVLVNELNQRNVSLTT